jgi:hypothetical protein
MEIVGLALVFAAVLAAWLVAARPGPLRRLGRRVGQACLDMLFAAAEWYAEPFLDSAACHGVVDGAVVVDPADTAEATATARLLDGRISGAEYRTAMAELARLDADRRPVSLPPLSDR